MVKITAHMRLLAICALVLLAVTIPLACTSGYGATTPTTQVSSASGNTVTISNFSFSPATLTVTVGTTVTWTNKDSVTHTVTSDLDEFDSGNVPPNGSYSRAFNTAGTYTYHCSIHTAMKGTVEVK